MTRPYQPNEKNHIIFKKGFKCLPAHLLSTPSCIGNFNEETVIRPNAYYSVLGYVICKFRRGHVEVTLKKSLKLNLRVFFPKKITHL